MGSVLDRHWAYARSRSTQAGTYCSPMFISEAFHVPLMAEEVGGLPSTSTATFTRCMPHPARPEIVVAAAAVGLCISRDSGASWVMEKEGLHASYCSAVAISGDNIFVSASKDHFAPEGRIYRRSLKLDGPLAPVEGGMPSWTGGIVDTGCIAASGSSIVIADKAGNLYSSEDFGQAWSCRSTGLSNPSGVLIC